MMAEAREGEFGRWRVAAHADPLAGRDGAETWLARVFGLDRLASTPAAAFDAASVPPSRLGADAIAALGKDCIGLAPLDRAHHSLGFGYADTIARRSGRVGLAVDGVALPRDAGDVETILRAAARHGLKIIPAGGGTSVVGGLDPALARGVPLVSLDLVHLSRLLAVAPRDARGRAEAGIRGPALDAALRAQGFVLGHYPQSFEGSTLGGWIAASGSGQHSGRYGRARDWFVSARVVTPRGVWNTEEWPASAAGPRLGDLVVGSEGAFGVITEATFRLRPVPSVVDDRGYVMPDFESGAEVIRLARAAGLDPAMLRLSDEDETRFLREFAALGARGSVKPRLADAYLRWRGMPATFTFLTASYEGEAREVAATRAGVERLVRAHGGLAAGAGPGRRWREGRYHGPHLRDALLDRGIGVETFETATTWSRLDPLYRATRAATLSAMARVMPAPGARGVVLCHVSHAYRDGASLYFTVVFPRRVGEEVAQWREIKIAAMDALRKNGGTLSHHHGVGLEHRRWLAEEKGEPAMDVLRAVKRALDPEHVLVSGLTGLDEDDG